MGDRGGRSHAGGGERLVGMAGEVGSQAIALSVEVHGDSAHLREVAHELQPGHLATALLEPTLQVDLQAQREEAGDDVADTVAVGVVEDGAHLERRLLLLKSPSFNNYAPIVGVSTSSLLNSSLCRFEISVK